MIIEGFARRFAALKAGKNQTEARFTHLESLGAAQVEPPGLELTRAGRRFWLAYNGTAPTGVVPVQAFPTTAAQWAIANGDLVKSQVYTALGAIAFSGTIGAGGLLLATIFQTPYNGGTAQATGVAIGSGSLSAIASKAVVKSSVTITAPSAPNWFPVADNVYGNVPTVPATVIANRGLEGRVIVPPQCSLGLVVMAPAGTSAAFVPFAEWAEIELDLE